MEIEEDIVTYNDIAEQIESHAPPQHYSTHPSRIPILESSTMVHHIQS